MANNKIVRSVCYFTDNPSSEITEKLTNIAKTLEDMGYLIQTTRICSAGKNIDALVGKADYLSIGTISYDEALEKLPKFYETKNLNFNIELAKETIDNKYAELLFKIIQERPDKTFSFTFVFNNAPSSPFFPSGNYEKNGFSIGLQPTDLSENCTSLDEWFSAMKTCWDEINETFKDNPDFLGIDSSIAPLLGGKGSLVNFVKRLGTTFDNSVTTDMYTKITKFIKESNPKLVGLSGMMLPCLEDDELAEEYEQGKFSIERNIFLSLHSGLGIDTYPVAVDEKPERVVEILTLLQALSNKYKKPLSARFVSDGKAKIGEKTDYQNQYLADVVLRRL